MNATAALRTARQIVHAPGAEYQYESHKQDARVWMHLSHISGTHQKHLDRAIYNTQVCLFIRRLTNVGARP